MAYSQKVILKVDEEFEAKRRLAEQKAYANAELVYLKVPAVREIDEALSLVGLNVYKAALMGKEGLDERIEKLKRENLELQQTRKMLLEQNGFAWDFTEPEYECTKCSDTGYIEIKMCDCKRKALVKAAFKASGLGASLTEQGFDNFDLRYYSDAPSQSGISDRDAMQSILEKSRKYVEDFGDEEKTSNLMFVGKTGLGKTHITTSIAKGIIEKGYDVVYDSAQNILGAFEGQRFHGDENAKIDTQRFFDCDLLIIDDLGSEFRNSFTQSVFYNLINTRINNSRATIISTNLEDMPSFKKAYDDRITSRLAGTFRIFKFCGEDIRLQKAKNIHN